MALWLEIAQGAFFPLKNRTFRYFFMAQSLSLLGRWVQATAQRWLLYDLTSSTTYLGLLGALGSFPLLLFSLPAGVLADHLSKKKVLITAQLIGATMAFLLGILVLGDWVRPWHILALAFGLGVGVALEFPVRNALIYEIVGKDDLVSALSLHSLAFNLSRFIGPALAGWLMGTLGLPFCFFFNSLSYLPVAGTVAFVEFRESTSRRNGNLLLALTEGLRFARRTPAVRETLLLLAGISVGLFPYAILLPAFVREALGGGAREFTFLMSVNGLGALVGAGFAGTFGRHLSRRKLIYLAALGLTVAVLGLTFVSGKIPAALALALGGFCMVNVVMNANAYVQSVSPDEIRGRVLGLFSWCFLGLLPAGSLLLGWAAREIGTPEALRGAALLAGSWLMLVYLIGGRRAHP